jgi:hypothetical protein
VDEHTDDGLVAEEASYSDSDELAESSESNESEGDEEESTLICRWWRDEASELDDDPPYESRLPAYPWWLLCE